VADVVVAGSLRGAGQHREHRLGAIERLDLGLLVDSRPHGQAIRARPSPCPAFQLDTFVSGQHHLERSGVGTTESND
jgi:hypothetical protein